ncbi:MAG: GAF domain-containing protein, partial [Anaerolineae bacterium]
MEEAPRTPPKGDLSAAAARARAAFDWNTAQSLYTQALAERPAGDRETTFALLEGRAECRRHLGDLAAWEADLAAMARLAGELGDVSRQIRVLNQTVGLRLYQGRLDEVRQVAEKAVALARDWDDVTLEADSLLSLGWACTALSDWSPAQKALERALHLSQQLGHQGGEARALYYIGRCVSRAGKREEVLAYLEPALALFRQLGDREWEGLALNLLGIVASDVAAQRAYYERALALAELTADRTLHFRLVNNLALTYWRLGLYRRACDYGERAVTVAREMQSPRALAYALESLSRPTLALGEAEHAKQWLEEGLDVARASGDRPLEAGHWGTLGMTALARGRPAEALDLLQRAADLAGEVELLGDKATVLAWQGAAHLAQGQADEARACTAQAVKLLEERGAPGEYPPQEIWWWRYRALTAPLPSEPERGDERRQGEAWAALDRAREAMLAGIATLSDEGLRRSYLGRVEINRQIVQEWLRHAAARDLPLEPLTDRLAGESDLQAQLQRMLDIGVRLNAQREVGDLPRYILDEVVELTGAERAALFLLDDQGDRWLAAESTPLFAQEGGTEEGQWLDEHAQLLDEAAQKRAPLLRHVPEGVPELEQRSLLSVPLLAQGKLVGLVVADLPGIFGRFSERDRDLLGVLANQAAVAVENARWADTLEQRVEVRTDQLQTANEDLRRRTAELEIVNSVQNALALQLDMQAIVDQVGNTLRDVFGGESTLIALHDPDTHLIQIPYWVGKHGRRIDAQPMELGQGLTSIVIETRQPLVLGTLEEMRAHGAVFVDDGDPVDTQSWMGVPILVGDRVTGIVAMHDYPQHRYGDSDVRLLSTITASMGVALENARLFEETTRLLEVTSQRNAELAVINRIQEGLAQELEFQAIVELVGDTLRDVFGGVSTYVALLDSDAGNIQFPYWVGERGQRIEKSPLELGEGLTSIVIETGQPLLLGTSEECPDRAVRMDDDDPREMESWMGVPILVGERVTGVVAVQDYPPHRYDDSDVRLLGTITASMGVALENARLFEETQRLLEETEQRNAELAVINTVQQGLVAEMDMQGIYDLVGDQIRDTFDAQTVILGTYDHNAERIFLPYFFEKGSRFYPAPSPFNDLHRHLIARRQVVRIDEDGERAMAEFGLRIVPGTEMPLSSMF